MRDIDWIGLLILFTGVGCLSVAFTIGPENDWQSPWVVATLVYSGLSVLGLCAWAKYTDRPLIPRSVLECCSLMLVYLLSGPFGTLTTFSDQRLLTEVYLDASMYTMHFHGFFLVSVLDILLHAGYSGAEPSRSWNTPPSTRRHWTRPQSVGGLLDAQNRQSLRGNGRRSVSIRRQYSPGILGLQRTGKQLFCLHLPVPDSQHLEHGLGSKCRGCKCPCRRVNEVSITDCLPSNM